MFIGMSREQAQQLFRQVVFTAQIVSTLYNQISPSPELKHQNTLNTAGSELGILKTFAHLRLLAINKRRKKSGHPLNSTYLDIMIITRSIDIDDFLYTVESKPISPAAMLKLFPPRMFVYLPGAAEVIIKSISFKKITTELHPWSFSDIPIFKNLYKLFDIENKTNLTKKQDCLNLNKGYLLNQQKKYKDSKTQDIGSINTIYYDEIVAIWSYLILSTKINLIKNKKSIRIKARNKFSQSEDELLALGILRYGTQFTKIAAHYVLAHDQNSINIRHKAHARPQAGQNTVRAATQLACQYLKTWEIVLIQKAMSQIDPKLSSNSNQKIGFETKFTKWNNIVNTKLPHRSTRLLSTLFKAHKLETFQNQNLQLKHKIILYADELKKLKIKTNILKLKKTYLNDGNEGSVPRLNSVANLLDFLKSYIIVLELSGLGIREILLQISKIINDTIDKQLHSEMSETAK
jgi:hypothetical protein